MLTVSIRYRDIIVSVPSDLLSLLELGERGRQRGNTISYVVGDSEAFEGSLDCRNLDMGSMNNPPSAHRVPVSEAQVHPKSEGQVPGLPQAWQRILTPR